MRVCVPANKIPHGARVTKPTGDKKYILLRWIKVYCPDGDTDSIETRTYKLTPSPGSPWVETTARVFLKSDDNDEVLNEYPGHKKLSYFVPDHELVRVYEEYLAQ